MALSPRAPIGQRLKAGRKNKALTQKAVASEIGISLSYLNLIENNKRVISGALLRRLADHLDLDLDSLTGQRETRLIGDVQEVLNQTLTSGKSASDGEVADFVGRFPDFADLLRRLYEQWQARLETDELLSERVRSDSSLREIGHQILSHITALRSFSEILAEGDSLEASQRQRFQSIVVSEATELSTLSRDFFTALSAMEQAGRSRSPTDEVDDMLTLANHYFPELEVEADQWRKSWSTPLTLDEATEAIDSLASPAIENIMAQATLSSPASQLLAEVALNAYRLRAALMPYETFLGALKDTALDLDALAARFRVPFDMVCERLVSLRKADKQGPQAAFLRADLAGNISGRVSNAVLNIPRYGSACPLWAIYRAVMTPGRTLAHRAQLVAGRDLLLIAKTLVPQVEAFGEQRKIYSVMLAFDWKDVAQSVYAPSLAQTAPLPIGPTCKFCTRRACQHRFEPSSIGLE